MFVIVVCTEGENSEPNYIKALNAVLFGTAARINFNTEVVLIPLGGNQGHSKIFEKADREIAEHSRKGGNILSAIEPSDDVKIEKWLIVDYDKMEKNDISEPEFRKKAVEFGYNLIINKPNFEFFILCHFLSVGEAIKVAPKDLKKKINELIEAYNNKNGFNVQEKSALRLPKYRKDRNTSNDLFWKLLDQNPGLIGKLANDIGGFTADRYSEMHKIIKRMIK